MKLDPVKSLYYSINEVYFVSTSTLKYLFSIIKGTGDSSQLGGPIRIAKVSGQVAEFGILPFLSMISHQPHHVLQYQTTYQINQYP